MAVCAVYGCKNKKKRRREHGDTVTYHRFPKEKDADAKRIRLMWISRCKRNDDFNADTHRICSNHFTEEDYERDLKNELLGKSCFCTPSIPTALLSLNIHRT